VIPLAMLVGGAIFVLLQVQTNGQATVALGLALFAWHVVGQVGEWLQSIHDRRVALRRWRRWHG
jgi:hypothetical protein